MAADTAYAKRVLLACNGGGDAVSRGVAVGLARHGCRLVLVGDEGALAATAEEGALARRCSPSAVCFRLSRRSRPLLAATPEPDASLPPAAAPPTPLPPARAARIVAASLEDALIKGTASSVSHLGLDSVKKMVLGSGSDCPLSCLCVSPIRNPRPGRGESIGQAPQAQPSTSPTHH